MGNKTLAVLSLWLLGFSAVYSQEIPIQLMLVDNAGFEKVNHNVKLRLTMSNDTSSTLGQYQEVHLTQSNEYGIISEHIGSGVATTNSQVLSLEQFTFLTNEPIIKVELDTSSVSNQYYTVGYVPYNYPMVARRALSADSSNYSDQSINSEYADTAEFARNFNESFDGDTSASNEIQELVLSQNGYLRLTNTSDSILLRNTSNDSRISSLKSTAAVNGSCYQGNPQVFSLDTLSSYGWAVPCVIFDSVGVFLTASGNNSFSLLTLNLFNGNIISFKNWGSNHVVSTQNEEHAYIFENGVIYQLNEQCSYIDTISTSSSTPAVKEHFASFDNGDLTWLVGSSLFYFDVSSDSITSASVTIQQGSHRLTAIGTDSLLLDNILFKPSNGNSLQQYNFQDARFDRYFYVRSKRRIIFQVDNSDRRWYHCDLNGQDSQVLLWGNGNELSMKNVTIESMILFRSTSTSGFRNYNGYRTDTREWLCLDINGVVQSVKPYNHNSDFHSLGSYTVRYSNYFECITGSNEFKPGKLIRWARY